MRFVPLQEEYAYEEIGNNYLSGFRRLIFLNLSFPLSPNNDLWKICIRHSVSQQKNKIVYLS